MVKNSADTRILRFPVSRTSVAFLAGTVFLLPGDRTPRREPPIGSARLISIEPMSSFDSCARLPAGASESNLFQDFEPVAYAADTADITRPPVRTIRDTYPIYSSVAVDTVRNEVILQDTNLFSVRI